VVYQSSTLEAMVMSSVKVNPCFWRGKKVFLTGHTGFKGSWLSLWLSSMGAEVTGYALAPNTNPNLYDVLDIKSLINLSMIGDIRNLDLLQNTMSNANPDIVIHMAAQPLVRYSYLNPVETYATNVMGTVNVLEATRHVESVRATVVVTSDKCYENKEQDRGYTEHEPMGGYDPYSNSKGCAELVTSSYRQSYFSNNTRENFLASARAGNVIGGGDWSEDRLIPDAIRAFESGKPIILRNPLATRPWQHVLEPLSGYLILAEALFEKGSAFTSAWNFGPLDKDNRSVKDVIDLIISEWGNSALWKCDETENPHEAKLLKLDCTKANIQLGWTPKWSLEIATQKIVEWQKKFNSNENMNKFSLKQIEEYQSNLY